MEKSIWNHRFWTCTASYKRKILKPLSHPLLAHSSVRQPSPSRQAQLCPWYLQQSPSSGYSQSYLILKTSDSPHSFSLSPPGLHSRLSCWKGWLMKGPCVQCITRLNSIKSRTCKIEEYWSASVLYLVPSQVSTSIRNGLGRGQGAFLWVIKSQKIWAG